MDHHTTRLFDLEELVEGIMGLGSARLNASGAEVKVYVRSKHVACNIEWDIPGQSRHLCLTPTTEPEHLSQITPRCTGGSAGVGVACLSTNCAGTGTATGVTDLALGAWDEGLVQAMDSSICAAVGTSGQALGMVAGGSVPGTGAVFDTKLSVIIRPRSVLKVVSRE